MTGAIVDGSGNAGKVRGMRGPVRGRWLPLALLLCALFAALPLGAQQKAPSPALPPPVQFRGISLGMDLEAVKSALKVDPLFRYRGDPDVSFLPRSSQYLIECEGGSWVRRAYFQFADSRLFIMILVLDPSRLDHYSMWSALSEKYGPPSILDPEQSTWQSGTVRFSLERPLTVKYVDNKTFSAILSKGGAQKDLEQMSRESFIGQF